MKFQTVRFLGASIRRRIAAIVVLTVCVYLGVDHQLRRFAFNAAFQPVDRRAADIALEEVAIRIDARASALDALGATLAAGAPVDERTLETLGAHLAAVVDKDGAVERMAFVSSALAPKLQTAFPNQQWSGSHPLLRLERESGAVRGLMHVSGQLVLFALREFDAEGEERFAVIVEAVDGPRLDAIVADDECRIELARGPTALEPIEVATDITLVDGPDGAPRAIGPLRDRAGRPLGTISVTAPRAFTDLRAKIDEFELLTAVGMALLFPLVLLVLLQLVVTGPLRVLTDRVTAVGANDDASERIAYARSDEIGVLANAFDGLLEKLEASRRASLHIARMSGRADVAIDVAHSAGNAMNSIAVTTQLARQRAASVDVADLQAIHGALTAARGDLQRYIDEDPQGRHLLPYFESTIDNLRQQLADLDEDCAALEGHVDSVCMLLGRLQDASPNRNRGERELISLQTIADEVTRAVAGDQPEDIRFSVVATDPSPIECDTERVRDIVAALVTNASEATLAQSDGPREVMLRALTEGTMVQLIVADTGIGFEEREASNLFRQGYTTKGGGAGLGLHLAALMANELGGSLTIASPGPGLGATAVLSLPRAAGPQASVQGTTPQIADGVRRTA